MQAKNFQSLQIDSAQLQKGVKLGQGGYGQVFQGKWNKFTDVAIKYFFQEKLTQEAENEFQNEVYIMQSLRHPNIINLYGFCLNPTLLVMELMERSLYELLHSEEQIQDEYKIFVSQEIAKGLMQLHSQDILHRDLKSPNILINQNSVKITDFGLAKVKTTSKAISTQKQVGTIR